MPYMTNGKRDYKKQNKHYNSKPKNKKKRAANNLARQRALKAGRAKLGDYTDVHHKDNNPLNNSSKNTVVKSRSANRSFPRNKSGGHR